MARSQARIHTTVWRNRDFTALPASAQATYWMVLAQPDVNMAGIVPYMPHRWSTFRGDPHHLDDDLETLERHDFIVLDRDTHELWIRSFAKNDGALTSRTTRKSMWTSWTGTLSLTIRRRFLEQIDNRTVTFEDDTMTVIDEAIRAGWIASDDVTEARNTPSLDTPSDTPPEAPSHPPSDTPSDPVDNQNEMGRDDTETDTPSDTPSRGVLRARLPSPPPPPPPPGDTRANGQQPGDPNHPPATNDKPTTPTPKTPRRWDYAWKPIETHVRRYGRDDPDKPDLTLDPRSQAALRSIGGLSAIRRDEANKFDFRDAWNELADQEA